MRRSFKIQIEFPPGYNPELALNTLQGYVFDFPVPGVDDQVVACEVRFVKILSPQFPG